MKRLVLLVSILLCLCSLQGQNTVVMGAQDGGTVVLSCPQIIQFYDPGGANGNYSNNSDYVQTFVSSTPNMCLQVSFNSFNTESGWDFLYVFDGNQLVNRYSGSSSPGSITASSGTLTFVFHSDGSVNKAGWSATITCVSCSSSSSDNGIVTLTCPQTVNFYDPGGASGPYPNNSNFIRTYVSSNPDMCLQVNFNSFNTESSYDYLYVFDGSQLVGEFSGNTSIGTISSISGSLTFFFYSDDATNYSGWNATITCVECPNYPEGCIPQSTSAGSPCAANGIRPFCTEDNDFNVAYPSVTGSHTAASFLGSSGYACLGSSPRPSWFYMQIENPGNLLIYIEQRAGVLPNGQPDPNSSGRDIDFACWGPFEAQSQEDFVEKLCCGFYNLDDIDNNSHRPTNGNHSTPDAGSNPPTWGGYPEGNMIDCSYNYQSTEWCYIPNAQPGQWYLLMVCNYSSSSGYFGFTSQPTSSYGGGQATTNCDLIAPISSNAPLCEGDTLMLTCTNPQSGATYHWSGPNGWTATTTVPTVSIPNVSASNSGTYSLQLTGVGVTVDPAHIDVLITANPQVTLTASVDTICRGSNTTLQVSGASTYTWSPTVPSNRIVSPTTTTTYTVTGTTGSCVATASHTIVVHQRPTVSISTIPANATVCKGDTAVLHATGALSYQWRQGNDVFAEGDSVRVAPQTTTTYRVVATSSEGCVNTATKTVTVRSLPTASVSGVGQICRGDSALLTASTATQYLWNTGATTRTVWVHPAVTTEYEVTVSNSYGCTSTATHQLNVFLPDSTSYQDTICWHETFQDANFTITEMLEAGTYRYETAYQTVSACDSVVILYLTIYPPSTPEVLYDTACGSFAWRGMTYTQSGVYVDSVVDVHGCLQVDTLYLVINHSVMSTETVEACESYTWINGQTYTASTNTPSHVLTNAQSCDSVVSLHLTVYHAVPEILYKDTCSFYSWHGNTYNTPGVYTFPVVDEHGCPRTDTLFLNIHYPSPASMSAQSCYSYEWFGTVYTESGAYTHGSSDENGCWQVDTLHLTINRPVHHVENRVACESYEWNGQVFNQSGTYLHTSIDAHGCTQVDTLHLTVHHVVPITERVIVCEPYTWHNTVYDATGVYLFSYTDQHNCPCTDTLHLRVATQPELTLTEVMDARCNQNNGEVKILASEGIPPYHYVYLPDNTTAQLTHLTPGNYHLQMIDSIGCTAEAYFTIDNIIHQAHVVRVEDAHCGRPDGTVELAVSGGYGQFTYQWSAPIVSDNNVAEHVRAGQYQVSVVDSNGCTLTLPFNVRDIPGPDACFYFSTTNEKIVTLVNCTSTDGLVLWGWTFGDGQNSEEWQPTHKYNEPGHYPVVLTVEDDNNCVDSLSLIYVIRDIPSFYLPSTFIPESDIAENRVFRVIGNSISEENFEMLVFDRWGQVLFVSRHPENGWDGYVNSRLAPQGTYSYVIRYEDIEGKPKIVKGSVLLLRK